MWISNGSIGLNFTLCAADCVHGKCWTKGGGEERYTKLSDMAWGVEYESAIAKLATWK